MKTTPSKLAALIAIAALSATTQAAPQTMTTQALAPYETQVRLFQPTQGLAATNSNDVRRFVYEWFTRFEHASAVDYYLGHLDDKQMSLTFPGMAPLASHSDYARWYDNLLANTAWNFHDVSALQVQPTAPQQYLVSFIVDWYGEVKPGSTQLAGWQSRPDSALYHHRLRQTWTVKAAGDRLLIEKLVVSAGDTPSPITR